MPSRSFPVVLALLTACGPDKSDDTAATSDTGDAGTTAPGTTTGTTGAASTSTGTPTTTGDATTGDGTTGDPADHDAMLACELPQICDEFLHGDGEDQGHEPEGFLDVERCILTGLRDGTPGRYVYGVASVYANGDDLERLQIHVHADRKVTFAGYYKGSHFDPPDEGSSYEKYGEAMTCTLVDPTFFDACFLEHDDYTHYASCMQSDLWWTDCAAMGPRCE